VLPFEIEQAAELVELAMQQRVLHL
jgi:hypothetical protein